MMLDSALGMTFLQLLQRSDHPFAIRRGDSATITTPARIVQLGARAENLLDRLPRALIQIGSGAHGADIDAAHRLAGHERSLQLRQARRGVEEIHMPDIA